MIPDFEAMLEAAYRVALRPGDIAIDIGAHVGRHTLPMARLLGPMGKVFAFEPLPSSYSELKAKLARAEKTDSNLAAVVTHNVALGDKEGEAQFVFVPDFPEYSGFKERVYHVDSLRWETITVTVRQLDSFRADLGKVRFIKVDAEGGELTILRGAKMIIADSLPIVVFEVGNSSLVNYSYASGDYFDFFSNWGYTVFSIFGVPLSREAFVSAAEEQLFWSYVAVPPGELWPFGHEPIRALVHQLNMALNPPTAGVIARPYDVKFAQLLARAKVAETHVAALHASTSWRITRPLRWVSELLRR